MTVIGGWRHHDRRDHLRQLRSFCHVARLGSIARAAEDLDISQQALSLHLRDLESTLDAVLYERDASGVSLTPAGELLQELAEPLVQGLDALFVDRMEPDEDSTPPPRVHVAASPAGAVHILPPYVKQFRDRYSDIRLRVRSCQMSEGMRLLHDGDVEFMLGMKEPYPEATFEYRQLLLYDIVLITASDHPLAALDSISPGDVSRWPFIMPPPGTYSRQFGENMALRLGFDFRIVIETGGWGTIKRYVEEGLGIAVIPSISLSEADRTGGALKITPLGEYFPTRSYGVFTRRGGRLTPGAQYLLGLMLPDFFQLVPGDHAPPAERQEGGSILWLPTADGRA